MFKMYANSCQSSYDFRLDQNSQLLSQKANYFSSNTCRSNKNDRFIDRDA